MENLTEQTENLNQTGQSSKLFTHLDHVIEVSQKKFDMEKAANSDRQAWGRIIVSAVQAYGKLVELAEIEEVKQRIEALEKMVTK